MTLDTAALATRIGRHLERAAGAATLDAALDAVDAARADYVAGLSLQEAFDTVRAAAYRRCFELASTDPRRAERVLVDDTIDACLDVLGDDRAGFHGAKQELTGLVAEWIAGSPPAERARLRDAVLDRLLPRIRARSYAAVAVAVAVGLRRGDLEEALAAQLDATDAADRKQAIDALVQLGMPPVVRPRAVAVARELLGRGDLPREGKWLFDASDLPQIAPLVAACPDARAWWRGAASLAEVPGAVAFRHRGDAAVEDAAWETVRGVLAAERARSFVTMQFVGDLSSIESPKLPGDVLAWLATGPAGGLDHALHRLLGCVAPAHRAGWVNVNEVSRAWLRRLVAPRTEPARGGRDWDRNEHALRLLLCMGDPWPLELVQDPDAVRTTELLALLACDASGPPPRPPEDYASLLAAALARQSPSRASTRNWALVAELDPARLAAVEWEGARGWHPAALAGVADALGTLPTSLDLRPAKALLWRLGAHTSSPVREAALTALAQIAPDELFQRACALLDGDEDARVRGAEWLGFCTARDPDELARWLAPLDSDPCASVGCAAAQAGSGVIRRRRAGVALERVIALAVGAPSAAVLAAAWIEYEVLARYASSVHVRALARVAVSGRCSVLARRSLERVIQQFRAEEAWREVAPWASKVGEIEESTYQLRIRDADGVLRARGVVWFDGVVWGAELRSDEPGRHVGQELSQPSEFGPLRILDRPAPRHGGVGNGDGEGGPSLGDVRVSAPGWERTMQLVRWFRDRCELRGSGPPPLSLD